MLSIIVAGAGITGLTAAISLRRAGHQVEIYERSSLNNEVGAAIHVPPNATRFLTAWGLDPRVSRFVTAKILTFHDHASLETTTLVHTAGNAARVGGAELYHAHREDLHKALKHMATRPDGSGIPVKIHRASPIVAYNSVIPSITIKGGLEVQADVVIGADGVHSIASEAVVLRKNQPVPTLNANFCYRILIPTEVLEEDPETRFWNENIDGVTRLFIDGEGDRKMVAYACRESNTIHNFVLFFSDDKMSQDGENWQAKVDIQEVLDRFSGWNPSLLHVISKAGTASQWPLLYRKPLETWHRDFLAIAGDAAHPMLPYQAQGAAQGMEDGVAIGIALCGASPDDREGIKQRLQLYEQARRPRASVVQVMSNVSQDQVGTMKDELLQYLPENEIPTNAKESPNLTYGYNVVEKMLETMKNNLDPEFQLPEDFFDSQVPEVPEETRRQLSRCGMTITTKMEDIVPDNFGNVKC